MNIRWRVLAILIAIISFWCRLSFSQQFSDKGLLNKKDDYEFAQLLAEKGYEELANKLAIKIEEESRDAETARQAKLLRCNLLKIKAQKESDLNTQKNLYKQVIEGYQDIIDGASSPSLRYRTMLDLANILQSQGRLYNEKAKEVSESEKSVYYNESDETLKKALKMYKDVKSATDAAGNAINSSKEAEFRYEAWYYVCETLYLIAQNRKETNVDRGEDLLRDVLKNCESFIWEYEGYMASYHVMLIMGDAYQGLMKYKQANNCFDTVLNLPKDKAKPIRIKASFFKGGALFRSGQYEETVNLINDMQQDYPDFLDNYFGQGAILEMCKAYMALGKSKEAVELAQKVVSKSNTAWAWKAQILIQSWGAEDPSVLYDTKISYTVAITLWRKEKYQQAILAFLNVISSIKSVDDQEKYGYDSWFKLAQSFWFLNLYYEAGVTYSTCYKQFPNIYTLGARGEKQPVADKCAYWAYRSFQKAEAKKEADEITEDIKKNWAQSPYYLNLAYVKANDLEEKAKTSGEKFNSSLSLFNIDIKHIKDLDNCNVSENLKKEFKDKNISLSQTVKIEISEKEKEWIINDEGSKQKYIVKGKPDVLNVYRFPSLNECESVLSLFNEAFNAYSQDVKPRAEMYERALVNKGTSRYEAGEFLMDQALILPKKATKETELYNAKIQELFKNAEDEITKYRESVKDSSLTGEERIARRKESLALSLYYLSLIYIKKGKLDIALDRYKELRNKYSDGDGIINKTGLQLQLQDALIKEALSIPNVDEKKLSEAEEILKDMEKSQVSQDSDYLSISYNWIGNAYFEKARALEKEKKDNQKELCTAGDYIYKWIKSKQNPSLKEIERAGDILANLGEKLKSKTADKAKEYYLKASELFQAIEKTTPPDREENLKLKLGECLINLNKYQEAIEIFYPLYQEDREKRIEKAKTSGQEPELKENIGYLIKVSNILKEIAEKQLEEKDLNKIFYKSINWARVDFIWEINSVRFPTQRDLKNNVMQVWQWTKWVNTGSFPSEAEIQLKDKEIEKGALNEKSPTAYLRKCYLGEIYSGYPEEPEKREEFKKLPFIKKREYLHRLTVLRGFSLNNRLIDLLPENIKEGPNPDWWEAKYRQISFLYMLGQGDQANNIIKTLKALYKYPNIQEQLDKISKNKK